MSVVKLMELTHTYNQMTPKTAQTSAATLATARRFLQTFRYTGDRAGESFWDRHGEEGWQCSAVIQKIVATAVSEQ